MAPSPGTRLGPYEILSRLGAGGMGEVYRARDTRLGRDVAIKVLPERTAHDPDARERLDREARAVSSLNDPHICTLHDVGHQDGTDYLVMELLEGETLLDRLKRGPLPLDRMLQTAIEIAAALHKAHRHGVIHRDLKPGNVMLTKAGPKLMDFGLARRVVAAGTEDGLSAVPTREKPLTGAGALLGTYQYMAPEQLEGKEADARSDIWALGCLIYEMATGKRAFEGTSQASLISAILASEPPPMAQLQPLAPPALERLLKACLAKDPDERLQSAHDVVQELRWMAEGTSAPARRPGLPGKERVVWALAILAAGLAGWKLTRSEARERPSLRVTEAVRFTHETGLFGSPSWSPDGKFVAFASNRSGNFEIYVRRADGGQEVNVTGHPSEDIQPAFSPDGRSIAFVSTRSSRTGLIPIGTEVGMDLRTFGGDLWIIPALGGNARRIAPDANYPAWRPDGGAVLYVFGPDSHRGLREVSPDGASSRDLLSSRESTFEMTRPHYSPDGRWISFDDSKGKLCIMPAGGGTPRCLLVGVDQAWADDGTLFFLRRGAAGGTMIGHVALDATGAPLVGSEQNLAVLTGSMCDLAVAVGGRVLALSQLDAGFDLTRIALTPDGSRTTGPEEALSAGSVRVRYPAFSFDGQKLAYSSNRGGPDEVWVLDLKTLRQDRLPVPQDDLGTYLPTWLPAGDGLIVKRFQQGGPATLWRLSLDGSSVEALTKPGEIAPMGTMSVSPDGRRAIFMRQEPTDMELYEIDLASRAQRLLKTTEGSKFDPFCSRDGAQIAYFATTQGGPLQLWTQPAGGGPARQLTSTADRWRHGSFSADGKWIYAQPSHRNIWRVPTAGGPLQQVTMWPESGLFIEEPTVSPDGRSLVYARWKGGASLWLLSLGAPGPGSPGKP